MFRGHAVHLIATPQQSLEAAAAAARAAGIEAHILGDEIEGESREVGKVHAALARAVARRGAALRPALRDPVGRRDHGHDPAARAGCAPRAAAGARASSARLAPSRCRARPNVWALAADTDGIDGVEDNAGAFVTPDTLARAAALGLQAADHLDRNDAYGFFDALGDLVVTGPTLTNVNDFRALLIL